MNFMESYENLLSQGPVFWAAAAAVAAGCTLLLVSLGIQIRKSLSGKKWKITTSALKKNQTNSQQSIHHPQINITETGYGLNGALPDSKEIGVQDPDMNSSPENTKELSQLLQRLRRAGDQLEELQSNVTYDQTPVHNSLLKEHSENVEYLIRTGIS